MSEIQMESARAVNAQRPQESAIHNEIYSPTSKWSSFEELNAWRNGDRNANYLEMTDPYKMDGSSLAAPKIGDPNRVDFRQNNQEHAIFDGIKAGEIDFDEYKDLQQEQDLISQAQEYFGADGFSKQELKNLDLLQSSARQHILKAGGADELMYANKSGAKEPGAEKPGEEKPEYGGSEEHGGSEKGGSEEGGSEKAGPEKGSEGEKPSEPGSEEEQFQQFMNFLDQNGDGQISLEELLQAFQAIDENQDGVISPEEFEKFMKKLSEQKQPGEQPGGGEKSGGGEQPGGEEHPGDKEPVDQAPQSPEPQEPTDGGDQSPEVPDTTNGGTYPDADQMKMIYIFPNSNEEWQKLNLDAPEGSLIVTLPSKDVSWDTDKPFNSISAQLRGNIAEASANGLNPMGYVGTRGATRPIEEVKAEIDSWYNNADIKGIYLGDSGNHDTNGGYHTDAATQAYFQEIGNYIRSKGGIAAVNGAGSPNQAYADNFIQGVAEGNPATMPVETSWQANYPPTQFAAMLVGVEQQDIAAAVQKARENHSGYVFVQSDYGNAPTANDAYWNEVIRSLKGSAAA